MSRLDKDLGKNLSSGRRDYKEAEVKNKKLVMSAPKSKL
jgi:hypothetical protein